MKKILLIISVFYILLGNICSAESGEILNDKSIKEIKNNINKLYIDRNNINNELTILTQDNNFISYLVKNGYFKTNITKDDLRNIESLIKNYNTVYTDTNQKLLDKSKNLEDISVEKKLLLELKKELYQNLIPYIKQDYFQEYINFIKGDANILKRDSDVKYELIQNKEILTNKVTKIEERIQIERKILSENLRIKVSNKIDEQILSIQNNPKFVLLSKDLQAKVIEKTIETVKLKIESTKQLISNDTILEQKIEIYELLLTKLESYYDTLIIKKQGE